MGAIYGQIAGVYYGFESIPSDLVKQLMKTDVICENIDKLMLEIKV